MKFGISKDIITPILPTRLACPQYDRDKAFADVHDDIFVRTLVLDDGSEKIVLMSFDLLFHDRVLNQTIETYAMEKYGVNPASIIISYTHAHTAPAVIGYNPGFHSDEYEEFLLTRAKNCLDRAMCTMGEGTLEYGTFDADFNISRRGEVDGKFISIPNVDYPHDTEFSVMCVRDMENNIRAIMMNYACHPVFYPTSRAVSGEFPARLCQYVDMMHYGCVSMFFQSAGGDVRPSTSADLENMRWKSPMTFADIDVFARNIADTVGGFVRNGGCKKLSLSIASDSFEIKLPMEPESIEYFKNYLCDCGDDMTNPNCVNADIIANGGYEKLEKSVVLHCQTVRVSDDLYITAMGGEPCFGVKQAVKAAFGGKSVLFIGYTDSCAYVVDDKILSEGGYEPTCHLEYGLIGPFKPGLDRLYLESFESSYTRIKNK